jgi:hypothetical protein
MPVSSLSVLPRSKELDGESDVSNGPHDTDVEVKDVTTIFATLKEPPVEVAAKYLPHSMDEPETDETDTITHDRKEELMPRRPHPRKPCKNSRLWANATTNLLISSKAEDQSS